MKRELGPFWRFINTIIGIAISGIALNYILNLGLFGFTMQENSYLYMLVGIASFLPGLCLLRAGGNVSRQGAMV